MVAQHELGGIGLQIALFRHPGVGVAPEVMLQQRQGDHEQYRSAQNLLFSN
jgi:hypothetical protein